MKAGVKFVNILAALSIVLVPLACSKQQQSQPAGTSDSPASTTQQQSETAAEKTRQKIALKSGYKVVDSFNVGRDVYVRSMRSDPAAKTLWIGTSVGVLEVDITTRNMLNSFTREQGLANEYVFGILVDSKGRKWFGTNGGGVTRYKDGQWKTYFPMHGLADYWVYSFAEQSNGTVWIGTWAGLSELNPDTEKFKTHVKELVNEWVYGLAVDAKDRVWIGTEGGVNMYDGKSWSVWTHQQGLGAPNNENLPLSTNTGLGTRSRHNLSVMTQGLKTYNPNYVFALIVAKDQSVWAGTWGGGVSHFDGKQWSNFTKQQGLAGNIVYSVAQDKNGDFWFGTDEGLTHYDGKNWETMNKDSGLLDDGIYAIDCMADTDQVWVGSRNGVTVISR